MDLDCWYLSAITGLDNLKPVTPAAQHPGESGNTDSILQDNTLEILYHFCCHAAIVTLRVKVPRLSPSIPSICSAIPSATLYERELMELFGLEIVGTPNTDRLVLSDDWPKGVYPLRKDFTGLPKKDGAR
jgi:Ni,Fe-hydrogenase III component G